MKFVIILMLFFFLKNTYGDPVMTTSITKNDSSMSSEARAKEWINSGPSWVFPSLPSISGLFLKNNPSKENDISQIKNRLYNLEVSHNYIIHTLQAIKTNLERINYLTKIYPTTSGDLRRVLFIPTEKSKLTNENLQVLLSTTSQPSTSSIIDQSDIDKNSKDSSTEHESSSQTNSSEKPMIDYNIKTNIQTTKQNVEMSDVVNTKPINNIIFPNNTNNYTENTTMKINNPQLLKENNFNQFEKLRKNTKKPSTDDINKN